MRRPLLGAAPVFLLALVCQFIATSASAQNLMVLKVGRVGETANGRVSVVLVSGAQITVPLVDIDFERSLAASGLPADPTSIRNTGPSFSELLVSPSMADAAIRTHCESEWSTNFQMRAFCENQQKQALQSLRSRPMTAGDRLTIRQQCGREWNTNFQMVNFCEEQQLKALQQLGR